jgi:type VI secretion system secreted protein VgrG
MNPSRSQREAAANPAGHASFASDAFARDTFEVLELHGSEALGEPFAFELTLLASRCDLDASAALREHACLRLHPQGSQAPVPYHGVLSRFEQLHSTDSHTLYRTTLVPRLWRLGLGRRCRSFTTEQPITDTLRKLLVDSALHDTTMRLRQPDAYRPRSFVCQYDESDLDFVHRWMQREGLFYLFEHDHDAERLLVIDHNALLPSPTTPVLWQPHQHMPTSHDRPCLHDWHALHQPLPQSLVLLQHNYRKARVQLHARAQVCPDGFGELALDHISFRDPDEGQRYARVHAQQLLCHARLFTARSTSCGLRCGQLIALQHHPRADFNRPYLITRVTHHAQRPTPSQPGADISYSCTLELIPHDTAFRTKPTTAWPRIPGTVGATVHARSPSPYAELDEHGRYSIRLHFDNPSPDNPQPCARVRMATPYAGSHHGMHMPLLAGTEVLVAFCNGMPDEPVITAAVPDSENPSPVNNLNPHLHHIRTAGGNHIQLNDRDNAQSIVLACPSHNTRIALGQPPSAGGTEGAGGFHVQTIGSSYTVITGTQILVLGGARNTAELGYHGRLVGGVDSSLAIGGATKWSAGYIATWGGGSAQEASATSWYLQSPSVELDADDAITLRAGFSPQALKYTRRWRRYAQASALAGSVINTTLAGDVLDLILRPPPGHPMDGEDWVETARQWGTPLGCGAFALGTQELVRHCLARCEQAGKDAHNAELELRQDHSQLRHRPDNGARQRALRLDPQGAELQSTPDAETEPRGWAWNPRQCKATAGDAEWFMQGHPARVRMAVGKETQLGVCAQRLALRCDEHAGLMLDKRRNVQVWSQDNSWESTDVVWIA